MTPGANKGDSFVSTTEGNATGAAKSLGRFGLAVLVSLASLLPLGLTVAFPPWDRVECQRRQILYWSEISKVESRSFAGWDTALAKEKWSRIQNPPSPSSDTYFTSKEYAINWLVLAIEWLVILSLAVIGYIKLSQRVFPDIQQQQPQR
jgi:hypothetical protein